MFEVNEMRIFFAEAVEVDGRQIPVGEEGVVYATNGATASMVRLDSGDEVRVPVRALREMHDGI